MPFCSRMPWCQFWQEVKDSALWWRERAASWVHANWRCVFRCSGFNGAWCLFANVQRGWFVSLACSVLRLHTVTSGTAVDVKLHRKLTLVWSVSQLLWSQRGHGDGSLLGWAVWTLSIPFWSDKLVWVCLPLCTTCLIGLVLKLCGVVFFLVAKLVFFFLHWRITPLLFSWGWGQTQD